TGIWLGNDDGELTKKVTGGNLPAEIWKTYMTQALKGQNPVPLPGLNRWRKPPPETTASVASAAPSAPTDILGQIFGDPAAPAPRQQAPSRRAPAKDDRNFVEKLFGIGE
ncbi:MAG: penicillin-binding protein, partial [Methylobacterium brachiatum]|nr:penicillin-binding protein [Methylobacterium brachiatum]